MNAVLIISSSPPSTKMIEELIGNEQIAIMKVASSGGEARRVLIDCDFELVIILTPLSDEFGETLALNIVKETVAGVLLIVKHEMADEVRSKVEDFGVFVVEKPISKIVFFQALKLVNASSKRMMGLKNENIKLQNKLKEIRLINRAKIILVQYLNMSEDEAHKYIEKQAMNRRVTKKEMAESILRTYGN